MALFDLQREVIEFEEVIEALGQTQEVLPWVAQYSLPIREVQMVCEHPEQIIDLQRQIKDLQTKQFLPLQRDHTELEWQIRTLKDKRDEARWRPTAPGTDEELQQELADMTQDAQQSGEEARSLRLQLANAFTLAARVAPPATQAPEDRGEKFPDSLEFSGTDRTQLRECIGQLRMVT